MGGQHLEKVATRDVGRTRIQVGAIRSGGAAVTVDVPKLGVIKNIKCFRSKFEAGALRYGEVFEDRHIEISAVRVIE